MKPEEEEHQSGSMVIFRKGYKAAGNTNQTVKEKESPESQLQDQSTQQWDFREARFQISSRIAPIPPRAKAAVREAEKAESEMSGWVRQKHTSAARYRINPTSTEDRQIFFMD